MLSESTNQHVLHICVWDLSFHEFHLRFCDSPEIQAEQCRLACVHVSEYQAMSHAPLGTLERMTDSSSIAQYTGVAVFCLGRQPA